MPASLHLARFSPREAGRMLRSTSRYRRLLQASSPELEIANLFLVAPFSPVPGGMLAPTTWALFCGWRTAAARDAFLHDDERLRPFSGAARERWGVSLDLVRVTRGTTYRGWSAEPDDVPPLRGDEPVATITHGMLYPRYAGTFQVNNARVARRIDRNPGVALSVGVADHAMMRSTFTIWRSKGDMVRFAHAPGAPHRPMKARSLDAPWLYDDFFARLRPVASVGTWGGVDPLAVARG